MTRSEFLEENGNLEFLKFQIEKQLSTLRKNYLTEHRKFKDLEKVIVCYSDNPEHKFEVFIREAYLDINFNVKYSVYKIAGDGSNSWFQLESSRMTFLESCNE